LFTSISINHQHFRLDSPKRSTSYRVQSLQASSKKLTCPRCRRTNRISADLDRRNCTRDYDIPFGQRDLRRGYIEKRSIYCFVKTDASSPLYLCKIDEKLAQPDALPRRDKKIHWTKT
jgi:hypothetical protein